MASTNFGRRMIRNCGPRRLPKFGYLKHKRKGPYPTSRIEKNPAFHRITSSDKNCSKTTCYKRLHSANTSQPTSVEGPVSSPSRLVLTPQLQPAPVGLLLPCVAGPTLTYSVTSPSCKICRVPTFFKVVKPWNQNGHSGRSYYSCGRCGTFRSWADSIGISGKNPRCLCNQPSRWGKSGREKQRGKAAQRIL
ncbi:hypothetical protein BDQ94DRAFT_127417 [Aspergillus welwitschiae]|uniref:GRF-like zinc ribbon domain-containing protein n=1 Tax=Aspergillus welwitschiae TaxID=1341132 RepID=A0A3F3PIL8_9EURO|nr:hypothetical protein BDQ94DRAFT_127417 [Aspergillus welwitschiae]RDH26804.1 hypothetical protein BDQ94DRAFT_127417 [Aspergillus welwitschiae]